MKKYLFRVVAVAAIIVIGALLINGFIPSTLALDTQPDYKNLPRGEWINIHQQSNGDAVSFTRQRHSGSAWDSKRSRLIIFGSDTHGRNWDNSIYTFDLKTRIWRQESAVSGPETYGVDEAGNAIAGGRESLHPWAMHTFDAVNYLPDADQLIVASSPKHLQPGRFGNWLKGVWDEVQNHPTWIYNFDKGHWRPAKGRSVSFFPYATAYDSARKLIVGFRPDGIYEYHGYSEKWIKVSNSGVRGYHTQAVFDEKNNAFLVFGSHPLSNDIHVYRGAAGIMETMPAKGLRPPATQHAPFAYHPLLGEAVAVVDNPKNQPPGASTWRYSLSLDRWEKIATAEFPFRLGMNYHMQYSSELNGLILFASTADEKPAIWVLRL